jgi:tetratricopeptide (TPR) repeat protein
MLDTGQLPLTGQPLSWFQEGLAFAASEEYEKAVVSFNSVIQERPDFYEAWYERGLSLEALGLYIEAIASFDRALNLRPKSDVLKVIWQDRGDALQYGLGRYEEAIACYDRVLQIQPDDGLAWQGRGNALLYGLNRHEEAIASYNRAICINPNDHLSWRNRGNALIELKRYEEAIASYDRALHIKPDDQVAWQARNQAMGRAGLDFKQPTTNPSWYGRGYTDDTFVSEEQETHVLEVGDEAANQHPRQPRFVVEDDFGKREIALDRDLYSIGRDPRCDICLHSQFASRQHATLMRIEQPDEQHVYRIVDGNLQGKRSTNGLIINGRKCHTQDLNPGDAVVFGPQVRATYQM